MQQAWITIATADVQEHMMNQLLSAYRTKGLASGQSDPLPGIINERCDYIRNRLTYKVQVSQTAHSIPPELKDVAIILIMEKVAARLPLANPISLNETWKNQVTRAYKDLDIAGTEEFAISTPLDPMERGGEIQKAPIYVVRSSDRVASIDQLNGW